MPNKSYKKHFILLSVVLILSVAGGITAGAVKFSLPQLLLEENRQILDLRIARVFLAVIAGGGLAVSGVALQAILRNPLAEPYLLGTSSGAGFGAACAVTAGISGLYLPIPAFLGASLSALIVYALAKQNNKISIHSLILSGVIVSMAFSGFIVFLVSVSSNEALHGIIWWLWGSLEVYDKALLILVGVITIISSLSIYVFSQDLNAISIGEEEALHLGINIETVKKVLLFLTALITSSLVCVCGVIGFIGLVIPHMMRTITGPNIKILLPASAITGAAFLVICDLLSRTLFPPIEIPVGVITTTIGAPIFILLLKKNHRGI